MSGPLSILRELLIIFYPGRFPIADIYGHFVFVAFVISGLLLIMMKTREVTSLKKQLDKSKPFFNANFEVYISAAVGKNDEDSIALITAHITNTGAPSILKNIVISVRIGDRLVLGDPIPLHQQGWHFKGELDGQSVDMTARPEDYLVRKCYDQPVVTGGGVTGVHFVLLRGINQNELYLANTISILSFEDVTGKKYEFKNTMTGERNPPVNPFTLQK